MGGGEYNRKHTSKLGGLSSKTSKDITSKILGKKTIKPYTGTNTTSKLMDTYLNETNPHRWDSNVPHLRYHQNCQRCGPALDLRLAGYDVEALGTKRTDNHGVFSDYFAESYKHFYNNAKWDSISAKDSGSAESQISGLLPEVGARAIVRIRWSDGKGHDIGGHVFNVVRTKTGILGLDGQTNSVFPIQNYLKKGLYDGSMHILVTNKGGGTPDLYTVNEKIVDQYIKHRKPKKNK